MSAGVPGMQRAPRSRRIISGRIIPVWDDPFTTDTLSSYYGGSGFSISGLKVSNGVLISTDNLGHEIIRNNLKLTTMKSVVKIIPGASGNYIVYLMGKYADIGNQIKLQWYLDGGGSIQLVVGTNGAFSARFVLSAPGTINPFWLVLRIVGNRIKAEVHKQDPAFGGPPYDSNIYILTSAEIPYIGADVFGSAGLGLGGYNGGYATTDWAMDDFIVVSEIDRAAF